MRALLVPLACASLIPCVAHADDPNSPARIQYEIDKAKADVDKRYGGRSERELSGDERAEKANAENDAANAVLAAHGTDAKSFNKMRAKMNDDNPEAVKSGQADQDFAKSVKDIKDKEDAKTKAKKTEDTGVIVEKGIPVTVENGVLVEHGIDKNTANNDSVAPPPEEVAQPVPSATAPEASAPATP